MSTNKDLHAPEIFAERIISGDRRALARAITLLENGAPEANRILSLLHQNAQLSKAKFIGITGPPGAGKSTLSDALVTCLRKRGEKVGLILVDPASPLTGGAILGDRLRLPGHSGDEWVFIRSMSNRGHLGGLSPTTAGAAALMQAAGFDRIIIETVGTGQAETEIAGLADTVVLVMVPGLGDDIQLMKAGIMEIADVFAVNKSDREGAALLAAEIKMSLTVSEENRFVPEVILTSALSGDGVGNLLDAIDRHYAYLEQSGLIEVSRKKRIKVQLNGALQGLFRNALAGISPEDLARISGQLEQCILDPYSAAEAIWNLITKKQ